MDIEEINARKDALEKTIRELLIEFSNETRMVVYGINFSVRPIYRMASREKVDQVYSCVVADIRLASND